MIVSVGNSFHLIEAQPKHNRNNNAENYFRGCSLQNLSSEKPQQANFKTLFQ